MYGYASIKSISETDDGVYLFVLIRVIGGKQNCLPRFCI